MVLRKKKEDLFFLMFQDFAKALEEMGDELYNIISNYHNVERSIADMKMSESECDVKSHAILNELNESFITPFDREDIFSIANQMDDLADYMEDAASKLLIYDVTSLKDDAVEMAKLIDDATTEVRKLFGTLPYSKKNDEAFDAIIEINRLENLGDDVFRRALVKLFRNETNAIELIKWKDIYENLEDTLDACEHLADTVRGILVKNA